jgi:hypothetical protein
LSLVGRDRDLTNLANLRKQYKIVLIKAGAGVGKSTLAREFLQTQFKKVIRIEMGLESGNVTPAEEKVSQILRKDFDEEPSRDFGINLDILREKLADRANPIGVLIDNLEPALDENYRFREKLRGYDALVAVLGDRDVFSFTLITSRRSLITPRARVHEYSLEGLDITAWQQYFHDCENGADSEALLQMCVAYNGNAKVMDILHGAIKNRFDGNIGAYWSRYKDALLADSELETLISVEMDWLRDNQPDAYKLLCRMGCYRYQDVKTVPFEGLICLLWDIPESRQACIVNYLSRTSLIEFKGEYYLHPAVRLSAKLRITENRLDWETANKIAAEFWVNSVSFIRNIDDAFMAFEAYNHYIEIKDFNAASQVICNQRKCELKLDKLECLGSSFYRLGLLEKINFAIENVKDKIDNIFNLSRLHLVLGYVKNLMGDIHKAIEEHRISAQFAISYLDLKISNENKFLIDRLKFTYCNSFVNIGLCKIDLWELEDALIYLENFLKFIQENKLDEDYVVGCFCLALINSYLKNNDKAKSLAELAYQKVDLNKLDMWASGYSYLFLGMTFNCIEELDRSFLCFNDAIEISKKLTTHKLRLKLTVVLDSCIENGVISLKHFSIIENPLNYFSGLALNAILRKHIFNLG